MDELMAEQQKIMSNPKYRLPPGGFYIHTVTARKKLEDIGWVISERIKERKKAEMVETV